MPTPATETAEFVRHRQQFVVVQASLLLHPDLSPEAKIVYQYLDMRSGIETWKVMRGNLNKLVTSTGRVGRKWGAPGRRGFQTGRQRLTEALFELVEAGYCKLVSTQHGKHWIFTDTPFAFSTSAERLATRLETDGLPNRVAKTVPDRTERAEVLQQHITPELATDAKTRLLVKFGELLTRHYPQRTVDLPKERKALTALLNAHGEEWVERAYRYLTVRGVHKPNSGYVRIVSLADLWNKRNTFAAEFTEATRTGKR